MKVTYLFVTGNVEIEVADEWGEVLMEQDRLLRNKDRRETRRHKSLDRLMDELGAQLTHQCDDTHNEIMDMISRMIRDLAGDMEWDQEFPKDGNRADILNYLYSQHACDGCIIAFKRAWAAYRKAVRP